MGEKCVSIGVFCGSAPGNDPAYTAAAIRTGALIGQAGYRLVYGGGGFGMMGEIARAVHKTGGTILGIMPDFLRSYELPSEWQQQLEITEDMQQRKTRMLAESDAFIILPGGPGTMDEFFEVVTCASLNVLPKPIIVVDVNGYFAPLQTLMTHMSQHGFMRDAVMASYRIVATPEDAIATINADLAG